MGRIVVLSAVLCAFAGGCDHIEGAAEAARGPGVAAVAGTGEILGMVSDGAALRDGAVRLGAEGPTVPVTAEGFFTFTSVAPGCYDVHLLEGGRETLSLDGAAACVRAGESLVMSIVFGQI